MIRKPAGPRKGIRVTVAGLKGEDLHFDYPNAVGWGIGASGEIGIGEPGNRMDANNNPLNDTIATFKEWRRVCYMKPR